MAKPVQNKISELLGGYWYTQECTGTQNVIQRT